MDQMFLDTGTLNRHQWKCVSLHSVRHLTPLLSRSVSSKIHFTGAVHGHHGNLGNVVEKEFETLCIKVQLYTMLCSFSVLFSWVFSIYAQGIKPCALHMHNCKLADDGCTPSISLPITTLNMNYTCNYGTVNFGWNCKLHFCLLLWSGRMKANSPTTVFSMLVKKGWQSNPGI